MAEVLLFHHAQGLTDGVREFAEKVGEAGHLVHTPDLFQGRTFATIDEGVAYASEEMGFEALVEQGTRIAEALPPNLVYAGFSLGGLPAQKLAQTRPDARGALLLHSCMPAEEFGAWPADVPVQIHAMEGDPFFSEEGGDIDAARALVDSVETAELFLYAGDQHLFADSSLPSYDKEATDLLIERVQNFLERV